MKCPNCLYESEQSFAFCPKCGTQAESAPQADFVPAVNPAASRLLPLLKDNMFLAICILISVTAAISFDVISILFTIFLWLTFAKSRKNIVDANHLRQISGTVYASYVLNNVASIILIVCGAIYTALMGYAIYSSPGSLDLIENSLTYRIPEIFDTLPFKDVIPHYFSVTIIIGICIGIFIGGIVSLLINVLGLRKIHRFVKSVHLGVSTNNYELAYLTAAKNWLIFFAVIKCLSTVTALGTGLSEALATGAQAAAIIISVILIKKYLNALANH